MPKLHDLQTVAAEMLARDDMARKLRDVGPPLVTLPMLAAEITAPPGAAAGDPESTRREQAARAHAAKTHMRLEASPAGTGRAATRVARDPAPAPRALRTAVPVHELLLRREETALRVLRSTVGGRSITAADIALALGGTFPELEPMGLAAVRWYTRPLSVRPGDALEVFASDESSQSLAGVQWQIVPVDTLALNNASSVVVSGNPTPVGSGTTSLPANGPGPFNREEVGYGWTAAFTVNVGSWAPGLYALEIDRGGGFHNDATSYFIVRPASPAARILFHFPWATTLAYAGGTQSAHLNLYEWADSRRLRRVSVDRPLDAFPYGADKRIRTHQHPLLLWSYLRSQGFALDPCTSIDLDRDPIDASYALFISSGHDEYWSKRMRDHVRAFVKAGGNAAFFSGNLCWGTVRFEDGGRTMVCYRNGVEDPFVGIDDAEVTVHPSAWPVDDPENLMAGVGFRRGPYSGGLRADYMVVASDPLFNGTGVQKPGDTCGYASFESDGCELTVDGKPLPPSDQPLGPGKYEPTGRDGTPLTFKVLAVAPMRWKGLDPNVDPKNPTSPLMKLVVTPGIAVLGYFSNGGTVFTASTAAWADQLADSKVAQVTYNVVNWLSKPVQGTAYQPPPARPPVPPLKLVNPAAWPAAWERPWVQIGAVPATAIAGCVTGHLLLGTHDGKILRLDPENPYGKPEPTAFPRLGGAVTSMCANLHGNLLAAGITPETVLVVPSQGITLGGGLTQFGGGTGAVIGNPTKLVHRSPDPTLKDAWVPLWSMDGPGDGKGDCIGLGSTAPWAYVGAREEDGDWLYASPGWQIDAVLGAHVVDPSQAVRIGRWPSRAVAICGSGHEGRLFAATSEGDLLSRDGDYDQRSVDLAWRRIGSVPPQTFALAHYHGRLFALSGTPGFATLHWRPASADVALREPSLLLFDNAGNATTAMLTSGGNLVPNGKALVAGAPFDLVGRAGDGLVLFYRRSGTSALGRFSPAGAFTQLQTFASFPISATRLAYVRPGRVLFYDGSNVLVGHFRAPLLPLLQSQVAFLPDWQGKLPAFTHVTDTNDGRVVFYHVNGPWLVTRFAGGALSVIAGGANAPANADQIVAAGQSCVLFYWQSGAGELWEVTPEGKLGLVAGFKPAGLGGKRVCGNENGVVLFRDPAASSFVCGFRNHPADPNACVAQLRELPAERGAVDGSWPFVLGVGPLA